MWRVRAGLGVLLLFFVGLSVCQPEPNGNYKYSVLLKDDAFAYYKLYWTVEEPHLRVAIVCKTTAFSQFGSMIGSDASIGSVDEDGNALVHDFILNAKTPPGNGTCPNAVCSEQMPEVVECDNNVNTVGGFRQGEHIVLEFTRPLAASDSCDRAVNEDDWILIAWGPGFVPMEIQEHASRFIISSDQIEWYRNDTVTTPSSSESSTSAEETTEESSTTSESTSPSSTSTQLPSETSNNAADTEEQPAESSEDLPLPLWQLIVAIVVLILIIAAVTVIIFVAIKKYRKKDDMGNFY